MLKAGIDEVFRNIILGHTLNGMGRHYMQPEEYELIEPIKKYTEYLDTKWVDSNSTSLQNVDQCVDR